MFHATRPCTSQVDRRFTSPRARRGNSSLHEFYRGRIEHANAEFDAHGLFEGRKYRGPLQDIIAYIHITMHAITALIRDFEPSRQRTGFGLFPHYRQVV